VTCGGGTDTGFFDQGDVLTVPNDCEHQNPLQNPTDADHSDTLRIETARLRPFLYFSSALELPRAGSYPKKSNHADRVGKWGSIIMKHSAGPAVRK
jgi:hypothetical protein